jgi:SAM-dependent methyltransferase
MSITRTILAEVAEYYSGKLAQHGDTARGVDWNGDESQYLRFAQLCKVIDETVPFSLNDLGCGYGALLDYLRAQFRAINYYGCDVSAEMIEAARRRHPSDASVHFSRSAEPPLLSDYGIASGIFNVRLRRSDGEWRIYLESMLDVLNRTSGKGFAFNCLTSYSESDKMKDYLYYADPLVLFDLCKRRYSREVALLHDYGLYEFTIIVRKC